MGCKQYISKNYQLNVKKCGKWVLTNGAPNSAFFTLNYSYPIPEPTSTIGLLAIGTLGAASTLKRKLKSSRSTQKETTRVG